MFQDSWLFVGPMLLVVLAFGMAIPNVLGRHWWIIKTALAPLRPFLACSITWRLAPG